MNASQVARPAHRASRLDALACRQRTTVLVIGGGINGISTFRELALQGLDVVLVERGDWCEAASGALSRMIHGGLRYMETGEFKLVRESLLERNRLLANAPHLVSPLPTTVPLFDYTSGITSAVQRFLGLTEKKARRGGVIVKIGLTLYDLFAAPSPMPKHRFAARAATFRRWPDFNPSIACSATYYDGQISQPERLGLEMVQDALAANPSALAVNHVRMCGVREGRVLLEDLPSGRRFALQPEVVVNATGAWIDFANATLSPPEAEPRRLIGGTKGSHLIVENRRLFDALGDEMVYYENQEGRVCILFRYFDRVLIGSTDIPVTDPDGLRCEDDEIDYILQSVRLIFPDLPIRREEIIYTFAGVRPLPVSDARMAGRISRDHSTPVVPATAERPFPIYCMVGGKWTTFRAFGEQVADKVLAALKRPRTVATTDLAIGGGAGFPTGLEARAAWVAACARDSGLAVARIEELLGRYGTRARSMALDLGRAGETPLAGLASFSRQELASLACHEDVETLADLLLRRTPIAITGRLTLRVAEEAADILATLKGWSPAERDQHLDAFIARLTSDHRVRLERSVDAYAEQRRVS